MNRQAFDMSDDCQKKNFIIKKSLRPVPSQVPVAGGERRGVKRRVGEEGEARKGRRVRKRGGDGESNAS